MGIDLTPAPRDYVRDQSRAVWVQDSQQAGTAPCSCSVPEDEASPDKPRQEPGGSDPPGQTPLLMRPVIPGGHGGKTSELCTQSSPSSPHTQLFPPLLLWVWAHPTPEAWQGWSTFQSCQPFSWSVTTARDTFLQSLPREGRDFPFRKTQRCVSWIHTQSIPWE